MTDWETRYYEAEALHTEANGMLTAENERLKRLHTDAVHEAERWKEREAEARACISDGANENERLKRLHTDAFHEAERWKERYEEETLRHQSGRNAETSMQEQQRAATRPAEWPALTSGAVPAPPFDSPSTLDMRLIEAAWHLSQSNHPVSAAAVREAHDALMSRHQVCNVPEGWKLVPVDPTEAMAKAGYDAKERYRPAGYVWDAMLDAAPDYEFVAGKKPARTGCSREDELMCHRPDCDRGCHLRHAIGRES